LDAGRHYYSLPRAFRDEVVGFNQSGRYIFQAVFRRSRSPSKDAFRLSDNRRGFTL